MAFLDNSGDIILDAVLTDEGRRRLAMGNGRFTIDKFALADDEVDYSLYTPVTASGYQDLRILKLPVFEAFTNNVSSVKNKLLTYSNNTLLYLPVVKLNTKNESATAASPGPVGGYYVSVDTTTTDKILLEDKTASSSGYRFGQVGATAPQSRLIFDQGLDTADLTLGLMTGADAEAGLPGLAEKSYNVEVDNRLLGLITTGKGSPAQPFDVSEGNIATYYFPLGQDGSDYFATQGKGDVGGTASPAYQIVNTDSGNRVLNSMIGPTQTTGRLGSRLVFALRASQALQLSDNYFTTLGSTRTVDVGGTDVEFLAIDTVVRVTGVSTGYSVDVPLTLLKYTS
jgi:hypothetical protein